MFKTIIQGFDLPHYSSSKELLHSITPMVKQITFKQKGHHPILLEIKKDCVVYIDISNDMNSPDDKDELANKIRAEVKNDLDCIGVIFVTEAWLTIMQSYETQEDYERICNDPVESKKRRTEALMISAQARGDRVCMATMQIIRANGKLVDLGPEDYAAENLEGRFAEFFLKQTKMNLLKYEKELPDNCRKRGLL